MSKKMKPSIKKSYHRAYDLGVKRFYAPYTLSVWCDECKEMREFDLMEYELYEPIVNGEEEMQFTCQKCGEETEEITFKIDVVVSLVEDENE